MIAVAVPNVEIIELQNQPIEIIEIAIQGPAGRDGLNGSGAMMASFSWGDATPALLTVVPANKAILNLSVAIITAFNAASSLTIGDASNGAALFNMAGFDLTKAGTYSVAPDLTYTSNTDVLYTITLGSGVSSGRGVISITIEV